MPNSSRYEQSRQTYFDAVEVGQLPEPRGAEATEAQHMAEEQAGDMPTLTGARS